MMTKLMGVINITPDSFSDGNQFNSKETFAAKFQEVLGWCEIIDIGAESTAPNSSKVNSEVELKRFEEIFFPYIDGHDDPQITISVDTYKINVFKTVAIKIHDNWPLSKIIFNDVSGKLDGELLSLLRDFKVPFTYVLSHNLCPSRHETLNHMKYQNKLHDLAFIKSVVEFFILGIDKIKETKRDFIIDPCFGFSKSREQNHTLIKYFKTFLLQMPYSITCLFGISNKSFLRFPKDLDIKVEKNRLMLDQMQSIIMYDLAKESVQREIIFRVHAPLALDSALNVKKIYNI